MTSTQLTLKECRRRDWLVGVTEYRRPAHGGQMGFGQRVDLFGFIDLVAIRPGREESWLCIQATTEGQVTARARKIENDNGENAALLLKGGHDIEVWGWWKDDIANRWKFRRVAIVLTERGLERKELDAQVVVS